MGAGITGRELLSIFVHFVLFTALSKVRNATEQNLKQDLINGDKFWQPPLRQILTKEQKVLLQMQHILYKQSVFTVITAIFKSHLTCLKQIPPPPQLISDCAYQYW